MDGRLSKSTSHGNPVGDLLRGWCNRRAVRVEMFMPADDATEGTLAKLAR